MNLSFNIQPANIDTAGTDLYVEISGRGLSYIIMDNDRCIALVVYYFDADSSDESTANNIHQIIADQPVLQQKFNSTHIVYGYPQSVLVPLELMEAGTDINAILELMYGDVNERITRTDTVPRYGAQNIYGVPSVIEMVITRYFNFGEYVHLFSLLPCVIKEPGNHLYGIFSSGQLKLLLIKEGKLQAVQSYSYKVPEDVAYHTLNLCQSFDMNIADVAFHLTGMIDEQSALYSGLSRYFPGMKFERLPEQFEYPDELSQYPPHYFSHLFAIAACV